MRDKLIFSTITICLVCVAAFSVEGIPFNIFWDNELLHYIKTNEFTPALKQFAIEYDLNNLFNEDFSNKDWPAAKQSTFCDACADAIVALELIGKPKIITNIAINFCEEFVEPNNTVVCTGMVEKNAPIFFYMFNNYEIDPVDACGWVFADEGCVPNNPEERIWTVTIPDVPKPPVNEPAYPSPESVPTFKILHLSDLHVDLLYAPGTNAVCEAEYFCCRKESGNTSIVENQAGQWGDYRNCDLPYWTLEKIYDHISKTHQDIDFILWTGDIIPHIDWETDKNSTLYIMKNMTDLLLEYFPGIPVYPALGNHDTDEVNQFAQPYINDTRFDMSWLYDPLVEMWSNWLPHSCAESVAYSGSYNLLVKPGLRLISVNTNFCQDINWWLIIDSNDVAQELERLAETLQSAENFGESVYIIEHIAPGSCFDVYSHQYNLIIARYESTISGIFYGHSHKDHFKLFFDPEDYSRVYEIGYIGQSLTTYSEINPGYKIYTVEGEFTGSKFRVLDHENWNFPLDTANANPESEPEVNFLYTAMDEYGLTDLSPQSLLDFTYDMNEDDYLFRKFYKNYVKDSPYQDCDDQCKHNLICGIYKTDGTVHETCRIDM